MPVVAIGTLIALSSAFNAIATVINGEKQRKQQAEQHAQNRADAQGRFDQDFGLRTQQFLWSQKQAEQALIIRRNERNEDFLRQNIRDRNGRSFEHLRGIFNGSPDGIWLHDPYEAAHPGIQSLRILLQRPKGQTEIFYAELEREISDSIAKYRSLGTGASVHFPTGVWKDNAPTGSWVASELHAWQSTIPTLILRLSPSTDNTYVVEADIFGFPTSNGNFAQNINFGKISNDPKDIQAVLPLLTLAVSDMYFLSTYAKRPGLPFMLADYLEQSDAQTAQIVEGIVGVYRQTVTALLSEKPEMSDNRQIRLYSSLELADALTALPDKRHLIAQLRDIEDAARLMLPQSVELRQRMCGLYRKAGSEADAQRLLEQKPNDNKLKALEKIL
jgi:hypothetical protein